LIQADLPEGVRVEIASDSSVFVERSVHEVYRTLWEAAVLVVLMIFIFLRDWRATLIPLLAIPVSIVGSFAVMHLLGFTLNTLTLLALVLAVGLVVDDAIVMLENIYRRIEAGEAPIHAAVFGARQVTFAIIATTLTLAAVFLPVAFQKGQTGRLFYEFGVTLAVSVLVSAFVALTLTPMLCSRLLKVKMIDGRVRHGSFYRVTEPFFTGLNRTYERMLRGALEGRTAVLVAALLFAAAGPWLYFRLQRELMPLEDRGVFNASFTGPVGSTPEYNAVYSRQMESILLQLPEIDRTFHRTGEGRGSITATLKPWEDRSRKTQAVIDEARRRFRQEITGGQAAVTPVRPLSGGGGRGGVQLVLQGTDYDKLQDLGRQVLGVMRDSAVFVQPRVDPSPTKPQLDLHIDRAKAADLRVSISDVASTLETLLGGRRVSEFQRGNQQYDVILQTGGANRATPSDLNRLYVRSADGAVVQLGNLVTYDETAVPEGFPHFNRLRSVTVSAQLGPGHTIGDAVNFLSARTEGIMPPGYTFTWDGEAREFVESAAETYGLFALALAFTFLILAAQFESWIHPTTIFTGIVLAISGGLIVLYGTRWWGDALTDNIFRPGHAHRHGGEEWDPDRGVRQPAPGAGEERLRRGLRGGGDALPADRHDVDRDGAGGGSDRPCLGRGRGDAQPDGGRGGGRAQPGDLPHAVHRTDRLHPDGPHVPEAHGPVERARPDQGGANRARDPGSGGGGGVLTGLRRPTSRNARPSGDRWR
jgi:multidrug efflux pump